MHRILVADGIEAQGLEILRTIPDSMVDYYSSISREMLLQEIMDVEVLIVRSKTQVTSEILDEAKKLRIIARTGIGVDNIDITAATERGILVQNVPGGNKNAVAELTIAHALMLARNLPHAVADLSCLLWKPQNGIELFGKTLGIIGLGSIGSLVAQRAQALGMRTIAYDPYKPLSWFEEHNTARQDALYQLMCKADFITLHVPKTNETIGMIDASALAHCRKDAFIINASRGGIVNESDLIDALDVGVIRGAALDVMEREKVNLNEALVRHPRVIATPHIGGSTQEARATISVQAAQAIRTYLMQDRIMNAVNAPFLDVKEYDTNRPFCELGEYLTGFLIGTTDVFPSRIEVSLHSTHNNVAPVALQFIKRAIIQAYGKSTHDRRRDYINADHILRNQLHIELVHTYSNEIAESGISLRLLGQGQEHSIAGELFENGTPRITRIDDCHIEARFGRWMLFYRNEDRPGVIHQVSGILARHNINIDAIITENKPGPEAITIVRLSPPGDGNESVFEDAFRDLSGLVPMTGPQAQDPLIYSLRLIKIK